MGGGGGDHSKWLSSLVGQFLDKPLPFFFWLRKLWIICGVSKEGYENGRYIFIFNGQKTRDAVLEAKICHIANKPLILRK
jgi:hypothetical protein